MINSNKQNEKAYTVTIVSSKKKRRKLYFIPILIVLFFFLVTINYFTNQLQSKKIFAESVEKLSTEIVDIFSLDEGSISSSFSFQFDVSIASKLKEEKPAFLPYYQLIENLSQFQYLFQMTENNTSKNLNFMGFKEGEERFAFQSSYQNQHLYFSFAPFTSSIIDYGVIPSFITNLSSFKTVLTQKYLSEEEGVFSSSSQKQKRLRLSFSKEELEGFSPFLASLLSSYFDLETLAVQVYLNPVTEEAEMLEVLLKNTKGQILSFGYRDSTFVFMREGQVLYHLSYEKREGEVLFTLTNKKENTLASLSLKKGIGYSLTFVGFENQKEVFCLSGSFEKIEVVPRSFAVTSSVPWDQVRDSVLQTMNKTFYSYLYQMDF